MAINKNFRILLVEDNPDDEELTLLTLQENNISDYVFVLRDGAEAVDFLLRQGVHANRDVDQLPHLILLDIKLPKMHGVEVLSIVKQNERLQSIPVVMLTSSREVPDIEQCYKLGANSYIVKPVDYIQFQDAIKQLGLYWISLNEYAT